MKPPIFLIIGTSSSGKTTVINETIKHLSYKCVMIDPDDIFHELQIKNPHMNNKQIRKLYPGRFMDEVKSQKYRKYIIFIPFIDHRFDSELEEIKSHDLYVILWYTNLVKTIEYSKNRRDARPLDGIIKTFLELYIVDGDDCNADEVIDTIDNKKVISEIINEKKMRTNSVNVCVKDRSKYDVIFIDAKYSDLVEYVREVMN